MADPLRLLVEVNVRARFSLTATVFATRVREIARTHDIPDDALAAYADRLSLDDLYLATACAAGDEQAWAECVASHRDFLRGFAQRIVREPDATDVADAVIADLWDRRTIARYEGRSSLRTWLATLVSNASINVAKRVRSQSSRWAKASAADFASRDLEAGIEETERSEALAQLLAESIAQQPSADQLLILLYYEQGSTLDEIAGVLGLSKAALSRRLKRIRETLLSQTDVLARRRVGTSARSLAAGVDWAAVDLDLRAACRVAAKRRLI